MCKPLSNKNIVVTRSLTQGHDLVSLLEADGADVFHIPTIEIGPPDSWHHCDEILNSLHAFDWVVFTSTNGVQWFCKRLNEKDRDLRGFSTIKVAAVGESTLAALVKHGIEVDILPDEYHAEGLLRSFENVNMMGGRVLLPGTQTGGRTILRDQLAEMGAEAVMVPVYKTRQVKLHRAPDFKRFIRQERLDLITFTSPSTYKNFVIQLEADKFRNWLSGGCKLAAIGNVTADVIEKDGYSVAIIPEKSTISEFHKMIVEFYK